MKTMLTISAVLLATLMVGNSAEAGGYGVSSGFGNSYSGYGYQSYGNSGYGSQNFYRSNNHRFQSGYGSQRSFGRSYHNTTHLDYHPATIRRHGNHIDYTPGHYDVHRSGHWHR